MSWDWGWLLLGALLLVWLVPRVYERLAASNNSVRRKPGSLHPYHSVAIRSRGAACDVVRSVSGERFLAAEAPTIPLSGCTAKECHCVYVHFDDRRLIDRRALAVSSFHSADHKRDQRGASRGRRRGDMLHPPPAVSGWRRLQGG